MIRVFVCVCAYSWVQTHTRVFTVYFVFRYRDGHETCP